MLAWWFFAKAGAVFSLAFNWSAFATVRPSRAGAVRVVDVRQVGGDVFFDNGRRYVVADSAPVVVDLPAAWAAFVLPEGYLCPMCAQLALLRGAAWVFDGGRLQIGGALLMGAAGGVFAFASMETAARWVQLNRERAAAELAMLGKLTAGEAAAWVVKKRAGLAIRACAALENAAKQADVDKRGALLLEAAFCQEKW